MTVNVPGRPATAEATAAPGGDGAAGTAAGEKSERAEGAGSGHARDRGPSPWQGDRVRPLSRRQIEDRLQDLGVLYEETSGGSRNGDRDAFLRRLAGEVRRPGFALLIAENTTLTACAYGFPVRAADPWWQGHDARLPRRLHGLALTGGLFAVSGIVVPPRVRTHYQDRDWNLARRLQRRLLADHAPAVGVTLIPARTPRASRRTAHGAGRTSYRAPRLTPYVPYAPCEPPNEGSQGTRMALIHGSRAPAEC